ncbi:hypothetical protein ACHAWF_013589 [Thalassiosira exigua]
MESTMERSMLRQQIESDSPDLIELEVGNEGDEDYYPGYIPKDQEWASLGRHIGQHTHLKVMHFVVYDRDLRQPLDFDGEVGHFFRGVASNQSIEKLHLDLNESTLRDGTVFDLLTPFFKNNCKFECLELSNGKLTSPALQRLTKALGEFTQLKEFALYGCYILPEELFQALHGHTYLETLILSGSDIERGGCFALSSLLQKLDSAIQSLDFRHVTIDDDAAEVFGRGLAGSRSLKEIRLFGCHTSVRGWQVIFTALHDPSFSSLDFCLDPCLDHSFLSAAAHFFLFMSLPNQPNLKKLKLIIGRHWTNYAVAPTSWGALCGFIISQENRLEELDLSNNKLNHGSISLLWTSLVQNSTLKNLKLNHILTTPSTWGVLMAGISTILGNPNSALERLELCGNLFHRFDERNEALISLAASLENNTSLKELLLDDEFYEFMVPVGEGYISSQAWAALSSVLCSTSSIMATLSSNHTLQRLELIRSIPRDIASLLKLNRTNIGQTAHLKIVNTHFSGDIDMHPFVEMGAKMLPHAVAWMARGNTLNGLYQLVKYAIGREV